MNASTLIEQVEDAKENNWKNSDLWEKSENMLEAIAEHFKSCDKCRGAFDAQAYPEKTLLEFENMLSGTELSDWICDGD